VQFNPETARNEMVDFWAILLSPMSVNKIVHTVTNGFVLAAVVVIGISCWYLLKKREREFSIKSIWTAAIFGLVSSAILIFSGDSSAVQVYKHQPMKFAAMEGLYEGERGGALTAFGILNPKKEYGNSEDPFLFKVDIPYALSILAEKQLDAYVPGINNIIEGVEYSNSPGDTTVMIPFQEKIAKGTAAIQSLKNGEEINPDDFKYFGYGYLKTPQESIPPIALTFYSFRIMVALGCLFVLLFMAMIWGIWKEQKGTFRLDSCKWLLYGAIMCVPLVYICSQCGWIVAEVGRQPWAIQDLLPVGVAISQIPVSAVMTTFCIFALLFTLLLIIEIRIMCKAIAGFEFNLNK
jgi:cytochrome d ubiquinol oxidase subunit I